MELFKSGTKLKEKLLDGFYPTHKLGEGSGGEVYLHKTKEGESYAVKMMTCVEWEDQIEFYKDLIWQSMIYDELNKLETSIKVHGYNIYHGDDDVDYICFVMDYLDGYQDCWDYIGDDRCWTRHTVSPFNKKDNCKNTIYYVLERKNKLKYVQSLIKSLKEFHTSDIVHADIKPSNILISESGDVKFIDFGASIFMEDGRKYMETDWTHGTIGYRAPEEDQNNLLGKSSDIYSLGVTVIELWCGNIWYSGETFKACRSEVLKALRVIEKEEPEIGKVLRKCIDLHGKNRPTIQILEEFFQKF